MPTALLFGSFNPVHRGHVALAKYTIDRGLASEVWFVVSPQNPLKSPAELAPVQHRIEMVRLATEGLQGVVVSEIETTLPYPSYTVETLRQLRAQHPQREFVMLLGSDLVGELHLWREAEEIQKMVRFMVYPRGESRDRCSEEMTEAPLLDLDSTRCRAGLYPLTIEVEKALSPAVVEYIYSHELYAPRGWNRTIVGDSPSTNLSAEEHFHSGELRYQEGEFGRALNDFNAALELDPTHIRAEQMRAITLTILEFRHTDLYNP